MKKLESLNQDVQYLLNKHLAATERGKSSPRSLKLLIKMLEVREIAIIAGLV